MNKLTKILSLSLGVVLLGISSVKDINAQMESPLIVAPARQSFAADPGATERFAVRFYNTGIDPISGTFKVADFIVTDALGTPTFLEGPTVLSEKYAAASWVTLTQEKGTITPGGVVTLNATVKVPTNAAPGGKYFAVFFEPTTQTPDATETQQQKAASITVRLAGLIYLRVNGAISEGASITRFSAQGFSEYGPVTVTAEVKNNGDYHITPQGTITVKDMFGKEVAKADIPEANVFPGSSRVITTKLGEKWMVGKFTADLNAVYGDTGKELAATLSFWVFPWKLAVVIALGIIILILIIYLIINKFVKKEKKLEEALAEEKEELEKLKEKFQDVVSPGSTPPSEKTNP